VCGRHFGAKELEPLAGGPSLLSLEGGFSTLGGGFSGQNGVEYGSNTLIWMLAARNWLELVYLAFASQPSTAVTSTASVSRSRCTPISISPSALSGCKSLLHMHTQRVHTHIPSTPSIIRHRTPPTGDTSCLITTCCCACFGCCCCCAPIPADPAVPLFPFPEAVPTPRPLAAPPPRAVAAAAAATLRRSASVSCSRWLTTSRGLAGLLITASLTEIPSRKLLSSCRRSSFSLVSRACSWWMAALSNSALLKRLKNLRAMVVGVESLQR